MRLCVSLTTLFVGLSFLSTTAKADLIGSSVTATVYYPDTSTVFSGPIGPVVVGPGIEFPSGTGLANDGNLDVTGTQIIWTATVAVAYGAGAFNGFDLLFTGAPTITGVTVDGATTITPNSFSFTGNDVKFDLAGLSPSVGQETILDISLGRAAVPEPASVILLSTILLGLVVVARKRFTALRENS